MARKGAGLVGGTCVGLKDELGVECRCTKKASGAMLRSSLSGHQQEDGEAWWKQAREAAARQAEKMGTDLDAMTTRQATAGKSPPWTSQIRRPATTVAQRGKLGRGHGVSDVSRVPYSRQREIET